MSMVSRYHTPKNDPGLAQLGKAYAFIKDSPTLADTTELPLFLFKNQTSGTTSLQMVIYQRRFQVRAAYTGHLRFYAAPTITVAGSTKTTPTPRKVGGTASVIDVYTPPTTIGANGTLIDMLSSFNFGPTETSDAIIVVPAGTNLLVTVQGSNTGAAVLVEIDWVEVG